jgi:hypothetical protein
LRFSPELNRIGRRVIICMLLIVALEFARAMKEAAN